MAYNLLGMFQPQQSQMQTLLGEYYDPKAARMAWLGGALQAAGAGLASGRPGAWAEGLALGGSQGNENYRRRALAEYGIAKAKEDREYNRGRDAAADKRWQTEYDYRVKQDEEARKRQAEIDARQARIDGYAIADRNRLEAQRQAQEGYVTDWMGGMEQQGAGLPMSPGVRAIGRAGGVTGPSATDQWRFNNAQPYAGAEDYGSAFSQITAQPPAPEPPKSRTIRRGNQTVTQEWNPGTGAFEDIAQGDAFKTSPDTVINNGGDIKLTEAQSKDIHFYARGKYANADLSQNEDALLALGQQQGSKVPVVGNYLKSPEYRQAERAGKEFLAMILRKESGGAITAEEWQEYGPMFLPMPGDDAQTVADKRVARQRALDALRLGGGTATPLFDQIDEKFSSESSTPPANSSALKKKYGLEE